MQLKQLLPQNFAPSEQNLQRVDSSTATTPARWLITNLRHSRILPVVYSSAERLELLKSARRSFEAQQNARNYFQFIVEDRAYFKFESLKHYGEVLKQHILRQCPQYDITHPIIRQVLNNMVRYFYGMPGEYDLNKGIILYGPTGCGKSFLFDTVFKVNPTRPLVMHNAVEMAYEYQKLGSKMFDNYRSNTEQAPNKFGVRHRYRVFDDIGVESTQKHFGSEANVMQSLIELRYASDALTFATTNLSMKDIAETYGSRVASRFAEMFTFVDMSGLPDYRFKNSTT
jgi:predicted ATPase